MITMPLEQVGKAQYAILKSLRFIYIGDYTAAINIFLNLDIVEGNEDLAHEIYTLWHDGRVCSNDMYGFINDLQREIDKVVSQC